MYQTLLFSNLCQSVSVDACATFMSDGAHGMEVLMSSYVSTLNDTLQTFRATYAALPANASAAMLGAAQASTLTSADFYDLWHMDNELQLAFDQLEVVKMVGGRRAPLLCATLAGATNAGPRFADRRDDADVGQRPVLDAVLRRVRLHQRLHLRVLLPAVPAAPEQGAGALARPAAPHTDDAPDGDDGRRGRGRPWRSRPGQRRARARAPTAIAAHD